MAALAPRAVLVSAALRDDDFDVRGVREVITAARPVWALFGRPEALEATYPDAPHSFPGEARHRADNFLDRHLRP